MNRLFRSLVRAPAFTLVTVLTLGLGIGANAAIFSVVNGVLLKPLPFEDPDHLVGVWHTAPGLGFDQVNQSPALNFTYRDENRVFEDVGMWDNTQVAITGLAEPERVDGMLLTDGVLPLLRVQPMLGRAFTREDDSPGSTETVILSHAYWQRAFGGDPAVLGRTLRIDGRNREIIGVMAPGFRFLRFDPGVYLPFRYDPAETHMGDFSYQGIARLRPGVSIEAANEDVARMIPIATERFSSGLTLAMMREAGFGPNLHLLKEDLVGDVGSVLWVLLGAVGLVLLVACANVANLFLVRAEGRQREIAIRTAMGATRGRIVRQLLEESVVLGAVGGVLGLGLAYGGLQLLLSLAPDNLPRLDQIGIDGTVLGFTAVASLAAGLLFGMVPALQFARPHLVESLKEGSRGSTVGRERHRLRNTLAVAEVALALVLLIGSGLLWRTYQKLRDVQPGFQHPEEVLTVRVTIPSAEVEDPDQVLLAHERIRDALAAIPGVTSVGASSSVTMDGWDSNDAIYVEGFPVPENQLPPIRRFKWVTEGYFETMENPVLVGRAITRDDVRQRAPVAVITRNMALEYFDQPGDALGARIREWTEGPWREVVGVVGDVRDDGVAEDAPRVVYWPAAMTDFWGDSVRVQRSLNYVIRTSRPPSSLLAEARNAIWAVNPNLPLANVGTLQELLDRSLARISFTLIMIAIASGVAVILGMVGIYGVISYVVAQRAPELGVRLALGARGSQVAGLVLKQGGLVAGIGVVVGIGVALALTRLMSALLFGVSAVDPLTFVAAAVAVTAVSLLASYLPARRAAGIDPIETIRAE